MHFGVTFDSKDRASLDVVTGICKFLRESKHDVFLEEKIKNSPKNTKVSSIKSMEVDILISVGNSFNVLRTFRELGHTKIPVLSVSTSPTNFLPEITPDQFPNALEKIQKKDYVIEEHSRLEIKNGNGEMPMALNDIVITSKKSATIVSYSVIIDGKLAFKDIGDGVIISTPTGSTGYSASAGGPVIFPEAEVLVITPVSSLNQNKPVIINDSSIIQIKSIYGSVGAEIVIDGRQRTNITGNEVIIKNALAPAEFIKFKEFDKNPLEKLKKRMESGNQIAITAPPSAKFIFKVLQYEGALTQKELISMTAMPARTVRSGLNYLFKVGLVDEQKVLRDARYSVYYIKNKQ
ncbi:MAG: NAD(+)/NADH kinase [Candidatus Parvarchaeota archaeon]|nr:NAD(+)/NADH kinase [Candidatus Parvarchaeota archaeon]MCL5101212.1 NAD(+)/NADH kinase [Candidatus Parvarchaeota archaeon]